MRRSSETAAPTGAEAGTCGTATINEVYQSHRSVAIGMNPGAARRSNGGPRHPMLHSWQQHRHSPTIKAPGLVALAHMHPRYAAGWLGSAVQRDVTQHLAR